MLNIIVKQLNKPTETNFRQLATIAYDLTGLDFYNYYVQNYYSASEKQNFFGQFWELRNEVKQLIK
jgi:hypothetical protein